MLAGSRRVLPNGRQFARHSSRVTIPADTGRGTFEAVAPAEDANQRLNKYSAVITQRKSQGAGQAQLYATDAGKSDETMNQPQVGISSIWCVPEALVDRAPHWQPLQVRGQPVQHASAGPI